MRRFAALLFLLLVPALAVAQSSTVAPDDLELKVTVEEGSAAPYQGEMVLIEIHGIYRRHITREKLEQPDLEGFNWMQLGSDHWYESQLNGRTVKNFRRRMALFPDRAGTLTIGPFAHHLTLTDEHDNWFDHTVGSEPVTIQVEPAPEVSGWWFPVRRLEISDEWSNPPDRLAEGQGVLRVIRVTAVGVSPEMLPPMPELTSPSALIFPHPEKRLVELSPHGPVAVAFWRWTIRPTNGTLAIIEPVTFDYFDTTTRQAHTATISAQRVAMDETALPPARTGAPVAVKLSILPSASVAALAFLIVLVLRLKGRELLDPARISALDPERRGLRRAARQGDIAALRRHAATLLRRDGGEDRAALLAELDSAVFRRAAPPLDPRAFTRRFLAAHPAADRATLKPGNIVRG